MPKHAFVFAAVAALCAAPCMGETERNDTAALQARIDDVAAKGGGEVVVARGEYIVATLRLRDNVTLRLEKDAYIYGSANRDDYAAYKNEGDTAASVVSAEGVTNVAIVGEGVIDGRGRLHDRVAKKSAQGEWRLEPGRNVVYFHNCRDVRLEGVTLRCGSSWTCHLRGCDGVVARNVKIWNHCQKSNDGFDIESRNVLVEDCDVDTEDDALAIKAREPDSVVENVVVRRCRFSTNAEHIKIGTETLGTIRNVLVEDCDVACRTPMVHVNPQYRLGLPGVDTLQCALSAISLLLVDGGSIEDVVVRDVRIGEGIMTPVCLRYGDRKPRRLPGRGFFRNILIERVCMSAPSVSSIASSITGVPGFRIENVTFRDCKFVAKGGGRAKDAAEVIADERADAYPYPWTLESMLPAWGFYIRHSDGIRFESVEMECVDKDEARPCFKADDATYAVCEKRFDRVEPIHPPNNDESKVGPYELEDPCTFADGTPLASAADWPKRRREILGIFAREMFGVEPPPPEALVCDLVSEKVAVAGFGIRRLYKMYFKPDRTGPCIWWAMWLPRHAKGKVPMVVGLTYRGVHELVGDKDLPVSEGWSRFRPSMGVVGHRATAQSRGAMLDQESSTAFPLGMILARGCGVMCASYTEVSPDPDPFYADGVDQYEFAVTNGVFTLWGPRDETRDDNTTSLGAWAWALSRGLDLALRQREVDPEKTCVTGCSRLGKAALIAAARDERFKYCVPNQCGGGGVCLAKRDFGENVSTEVVMFRHWYCKAYAKYAENPAGTLHFDQHLLLAAIAPRRVLVQGFGPNNWMDTKGEYLACRAASKAWEFLSLPGLPDVGYPDYYDTSAIGPYLGYVRRTEGHGISAQDWQWLLDFLLRK